MRKNYHLKSDFRTIKHISSIVPGNGKPLKAKSIGRNEPCQCGSGKKSKHCHGTDTKYYKQ
jgi:uncharacterized protein YchJ